MGTPLDRRWLGPRLRALARGAVYALVIALHLRLLAALGGVAFTPAYQALALLAALLGAFALRSVALTPPWMTGRPRAPGTRLLRGWMAVLGLLLLAGWWFGEPAPGYSRPLLLAWGLSLPLLLALLHHFARWLLPQVRAAPRLTAVLVFPGARALPLAQKLESSSQHELVGYFDERAVAGLETLAYLGPVRNLVGYVRDHRIERVFVALPDEGAGRALHALEGLDRTPAEVYYLPDFAVQNLVGAELREVEGTPLLWRPPVPFHGADGRVKRLMDLVLATLLLALTGPLLLLLALALKLRAPAQPVLRRERRFGLDGQRFAALHLRAADEGLLARSGLATLPQLVNVLRGQMSLVGPAAQRVAHNEFYQRALRREHLHLRVRPGMTGWAQVQLGAGTALAENLEERLRLDLEYLRDWSPLLDLRILLLSLAAPRERE